MTTMRMLKTFDFSNREKQIYDWWEDSGWFRPECAPEDAVPFVISMPPPNVTGVLHIGHALFTTLEDLMIRYERMRGKAALWVPGTDHAGIATQLVVETMLREDGTRREEIGREAFLRRTWEWKGKYGGEITKQLRRLGTSCDWTRERFTLDDGLSNAVQEVFVQLYEQGLIYRGPRLVNWSPGLQTAVSDLEVDREEEEGKLYYFKYPVKGGENVPVATTRPETILGDTAVAVHPDDARYKHLVGKTAYVPVLNREIPIITDEYVDREFGTGALKITPGHDPNDYEIGQRHNLAIISVLTRKGTMSAAAGPYEGLDRFECRDKLWADMAVAGLTLKVEPYRYAIPRSQRGGEIIEPMLSTQWFLKIQPLADRAIAAVQDGQIKIVPQHFEKVYFHWLGNIQDWCISRQLWWGHRIPAWYREKDGDPCGEIFVGKEAPEGLGWTPEEDVLDTWFSSALWPFSTLGWPDETPDLQRFYPTDVMETGYDILFFWVARMIMMGLWFTGRSPFHTVYLHGLVRDAKGRKISKTLNNVIDPLELVEQYGADPLRFALVTSGTPGNDVNLDVSWVENNRNFVNKIWQLARFTTSNLDGKIELGLPPKHTLDLPSRWCLSRLNRLIQTVQRLFDNYLYGEAGKQIYSFLWQEFAPWYIEISKHPLYTGNDAEKDAARRVLVHTLDTCLRLLHPFMPFVTEEIWSYLPHDGEALIVAPWPEVEESYIEDEVEARMNVLMDMVRQIRDIRNNQYNIDPGKKLTIIVAPGNHRDDIVAYSYVFTRLCNVVEVELLPEGALAPKNSVSGIVSDVTIYLLLAEMVDIEAECARLTEEQEKLLAQIKKTEGMLNNENFVTKARPEIVERERNRLAELQAAAAQIAGRLAEMCR